MNENGAELIKGLHIPGEPQPESRFILPTDLCPNPERWNSTDGDSSELEVSELIGGLIRGLQPDYCLETGSGFGQTTKKISEALMVNLHGQLVSLETDSSRIVFLMGKIGYSCVRIIQENSLTFIPEKMIDFAFLDSFYELRVTEFMHFKPWMRKGTIVLFHDTAPGRGSHRIESGRDLRDEIEFCLKDFVRFIHLPTPRGLTICEVLS